MGRPVIHAYLTPGVYRTFPAPSPPPLALVRTDIAGFVGFAERGPLPEDFLPGFDPALVALRLTSWAGFQTNFGSFLPNGTLAYAVRGFFANGGNTCYVVRVAASRPPPQGVAPDRQPMAASIPLPAGPALPVGTLAGPGAGFTGRFSLAAGVAPESLVGNLITVGRAGLSQDVVVLAQLADAVRKRRGARV